MRKRLPNREALKLYLDYQKKYPDLYKGIPIPGRIALKKRGEFIVRVSKVFIQDAVLRNILFGKSDIGFRLPKITQYLIEREGSTDKALKYIDHIRTQLKVDETPYLPIRTLERIAKMRKYTPKQTENFIEQSAHVVKSSVNALRQRLGTVEDFIKNPSRYKHVTS